MTTRAALPQQSHCSHTCGHTAAAGSGQAGLVRVGGDVAVGQAQCDPHDSPAVPTFADELHVPAHTCSCWRQRREGAYCTIPRVMAPKCSPHQTSLPSVMENPGRVSASPRQQRPCCLSLNPPLSSLYTHARTRAPTHTRQRDRPVTPGVVCVSDLSLVVQRDSCRRPCMQFVRLV